MALGGPCPPQNHQGQPCAALEPLPIPQKHHQIRGLENLTSVSIE